eukprot:TRINITY_DN75494_c0_g1_i1.p1 TRINITY_DN75494_c0_g1~~TRINITY_DN75494_c0_g1_i1.p1  ORF type:complete len:144 (-),score=5.71 TRINITY_DN75494_c0_g1_i1:210-641(-)
MSSAGREDEVSSVPLVESSSAVESLVSRQSHVSIASSTSSERVALEDIPIGDSSITVSTEGETVRTNRDGSVVNIASSDTSQELHIAGQGRDHTQVPMNSPEADYGDAFPEQISQHSSTVGRWRRNCGNISQQKTCETEVMNV